jgi:hypothetical protein
MRSTMPGCENSDTGTPTAVWNVSVSSTVASFTERRSEYGVENGSPSTVRLWQCPQLAWR